MFAIIIRVSFIPNLPSNLAVSCYPKDVRSIRKGGKMSGEEKKRMKSVVCAGIAILAIAGCARANLVNPNSVVEDGIEYYIQTDKSVYDLGEDVELVYRITNLTDEVWRVNTMEDILVEAKRGQDFDEIWRFSLLHPPPPGPIFLRLQPGESTEISTIWPQIDIQGTMNPVDDISVAPGIYRIRGTLYPNQRDVSVAVDITIIPEPAKIYYVDADANGLNDGSSWTDAYNYLQDALVSASSGDEIWVAQGIYKPDQGVGITPGDRTATFQLISGVTLKGGYAGFGEPGPNARHFELYETILSGDLDGNDVDVNEPWDLWNEPSRAENSYTVVIGSGTDETAILDGFTITAGNANANGFWPNICGGGIYNDSGSPTLTNCTFNENSAKWGGGIYNFFYSNPAVKSCTFSGNSADSRGGGMGNFWYSSPTLTNCTFSGNSANSGGGGMSNSFSSPTLTNCTFSGNQALDGGGMYNDYSSPTLSNCTFSGNTAGQHGGGIYCQYGGGGLPGSGPPLGRALIITNSILWDDTPEEIYDEKSATIITYSDVQGGWPGEGNIDAEPCFVETGYWDANGVWIEGDYHLLPDSPCINAGDPNYIAEPNETDLDGKPRIIGGRIDMGAFEYSPAIPAEVRIVPRTINLTSKGKWITCYISLPEDYDVADIDPNSVLLEGEIEPEWFSVDEQQQVAIVRFSRSKVQGILNVGEAELTITGQLTDRTIFEGTDVIRVIDKGGKK